MPNLITLFLNLQFLYSSLNPYLPYPTLHFLSLFLMAHATQYLTCMSMYHILYVHTCSGPQWCPTLCNPIDCSLPGSSVRGIFQERIMQWVAVSFSRWSSRPRDQTLIVVSLALAASSLPLYYLGIPLLYTHVYIHIHVCVCVCVESGSVQSLSRVRLFVTPWIAAQQASLSITNSQSLLKLMSIKSVMPSSHLILCRPLLLLPPIPPASGSFPMSQLWASGGQSTGVSASHQSFHEHSGLISFRMDWLDLLAVQGTLKSLLQHHSLKVSIFRHSAFFTVQLSHPYMTTGKTIALSRWTFVGKVMSLLFNMLSVFI